LPPAAAYLSSAVLQFIANYWFPISTVSIALMHFGAYRVRLANVEKKQEALGGEIPTAIHGMREELSGMNKSIGKVKEDVAFIKGRIEGASRHNGRGI
jgi:hypothetical protein